MSVSTDGILCFGIFIEEGIELPWDEHGDIEDWWVEVVNEYKPPFEIYNAEGNFIDGKRPDEEEIREYHQHRREFLENYPLPVELVIHCSYEYPMYIIAAKGTKIEARRGYPEEVDPDNMWLTTEQHYSPTQFCEQFDIPFEDEPKWYLCSLWG